MGIYDGVIKTSAWENALGNFPKMECPFVRVGKDMLVTPAINAGYRWVFTKESVAVEKLDGTDVSIISANGQIITIMNRTNIINIWKDPPMFYEGIRSAIDSDRYRPSGGSIFTQNFGELVGPDVNKNPYALHRNKWYPFTYLIEHYRYNFWDEFVLTLEGKDDQFIYNEMSKLFKGLWSLMKRKTYPKGYPVYPKMEFFEPTEKDGFCNYAAEGIVFYNKSTGEMCKLRRDMFDWFVGGRHIEPEVEIKNKE